MSLSIIEDWLNEYADLSPEELPTFINSTCYNQEIVSAVYSVLEDRLQYNSLVEPVCNTLFTFYRAREVELQRFTLSFIPTLIYVYLNAVAHGEKKNCRGIEALLVGVYNLEAVDENCQSKNVSFRLPSLAQASIFHEPMSLAPASLTEAALRRLEECDSKLVGWGPMPQYNKIIAANRLCVMTSLLFVFNRHISNLQSDALLQLCKVASKLVGQGFSKPGKRAFYSNDVTPVLPRIPVSQPFLLQLLYSLYFSIFNGHEINGVQAIEEVHQRACYQGFSEVLLVTNAIKSSTHHFHSGVAADSAPMGISMAISPATTSTTMSKSMITNASFRTKKLPDDIPIQINKGEADSSGLGSISEEKEMGSNSDVIIKENTANNVIDGRGGPRRSLSKMAVSFGKKTKESAL